MKPHDPLDASRPQPSSSEVYAGEARRRGFYNVVGAQLAPADFEACIEHVGRVYGTDNKRGR